MSNVLRSIMCALIVFTFFNSAFAQDDDPPVIEEYSSIVVYDDKAIEDLSKELEQLQNQINNLAISAQSYARENQRLNAENAILQNELYRVNSELNRTRSLADDTTDRFDTSVVAVDQRDQMRLDYDRRIAECNEDGFGYGPWECDHQTNNFDVLDSTIKSK